MSAASDERVEQNPLEMTPEEFRRIGYRAVDMLAAQLERLQAREEPARRPIAAELRQSLLEQPAPARGSSADELLTYYEERILPYPLGHINPRFFGWVNSPAAPLGIVAEMLAAGVNSSVAGGDQAGTYIEHAVLDWMKTIVGFPRESGGILTSGASIATIVGLAVMRNTRAESGRVRAAGLLGESRPMVVYTSAEGHSCIQKAIELLGIGSDNLRKIPVDEAFRMNVDALERQIAADRAAGLRPACVVASAGTVNTGAVDPLERIADLCAREKLWFHVDGAYGGIAVLSPKVQMLYRGMERADSLGIDPHKWMYVPVECGCILVRDRGAMRETFSLVPPYLRDDRVLPWFSEFGPQQTRGFRALKLYMQLRQAGTDGYRRLIEHDLELSKQLRAKIAERPGLELLSSGPLSITCFRVRPRDGEDPNALNRTVLESVQQEGTSFLTSTELAGVYALRACIINFRTNDGDLEVLLDCVESAARRARGGT